MTGKQIAIWFFSIVFLGAILSMLWDFWRSGFNCLSSCGIVEYSSPCCGVSAYLILGGTIAAYVIFLFVLRDEKS